MSAPIDPTSADRPTEAASDAARHQLAWPLVAMREIHVRLTDRNFLIATAMTTAVLIGIMVLQGWLADRGDHHTMVVSSTQGKELAEAVSTEVHRANDKNTLTVRQVSDASAAHAALRDGTADTYLHHQDRGWTLTTKDGAASQQISAATADLVRTRALTDNATKAGTTVEALTAGSALAQDHLDGSQSAPLIQLIAGYVLAMLFYFVSLMFGVAIAQSVVEEKQSRIVEIIASAVSLRQLLFGKVIGNTALALAQMGLFVVTGLVGLQFTPYSAVLASVGGPVGWFVGFFLVGFVALACLWAVAGSLASRVEDLQATQQPLLLLVMLAFFGGMFSSGTVQVALSFVPISSAVTMPIRLLAGPVPIWQPLIALASNLAFAAVSVYVAERLYRRSILASGGRVGWRQAWSAAD